MALIDGTGFSRFAPKADVLLRRAGGLVTPYYPTANTDLARGTAFRAAVAAATAGDEILFFGTCNLDATVAPVNLPAGVTISGSGWEASILKSGLTQGQIGGSGCILEVASNVLLRNFKFWASDAGTNYQNPIGKLAAADPIATNVNLRNVWIYAPNTSDGLYHQINTVGSTYFMYDSRITCGYDAVAFLKSDAGDTLYAENSLFEVNGSLWNGSPNGIADNIVSVTQTMRFKGCRFVTRNDSSGATVTACAVTDNGNLTFEDCTFDTAASAGTVADLIVNATKSGTYTLINCSGSGSGGVVTTSNVTPTRKGDTYSTIKRAMSVQMFGPTTDVAAGNGAVYFVVPAVLAGYNLSSVHARVVTAGTTNLTSVQVTRDRGGSAVAMLSTVCSIDSTETGSDTAATPAVINTSNDDLATFDVLRFDVTAVQTTAPKGLICTLEFTRP